MIIVVAKLPNGETSVLLGRDGVEHIGKNYITTDTYHRFLRCLD